jgi:folate-dependent phosphoribosylglycinamide formyltransferase PurN
MTTLETTDQQSEGPPYNIAYLTSMREIYSPGGQEFVGHDIENLGYRMGNLEALVNAINDRRNPLSRLLRISTVVYDDTDTRMRKAGLDPQQEFEAGNWPWPHDLQVGENRSIHEVTHQVPLYTGEWRRARKSGSREDARTIRADREQALVDVLRQSETDLVLTDSITYIFQPGMAMLEQFRHRILNFHPAFLDNSDGKAIPGLYPTESALMRMREGRIKGEGGQIVEVPELRGYDRHGATVHKTVAEIDAGEIIHAEESVRILESDTQQSLRHRVFEAGHQVLFAGLENYLVREDVQQLLNQNRSPQAVLNTSIL